jgi:predicted nucleic acid-binding protein
VIVVDTNVLSELTRPSAEPRVLRWLSDQPVDALVTTAVTKAELLYGVRKMADGKRKAAMAEVIAAILEQFGGRILPFDASAAEKYALIVAGRERIGRPIQPLDAQVAAIAAARGAALASRDRDMRDCGIPLINPWDA